MAAPLGGAPRPRAGHANADTDTGHRPLAADDAAFNAVAADARHRRPRLYYRRRHPQPPSLHETAITAAPATLVTAAAAAIVIAAAAPTALSLEPKPTPCPDAMRCARADATADDDDDDDDVPNAASTDDADAADDDAVPSSSHNVAPSLREIPIRLGSGGSSACRSRARALDLTVKLSL